MAHLVGSRVSPRHIGEAGGSTEVNEDNVVAIPEKLTEACIVGGNEDSLGTSLAPNATKSNDQEQYQSHKTSQNEESTIRLDKIIDLSSSQKKALQNVKTKSTELHEKVMPKLEKRVVALGYSSENLHSLLLYIQNDAPIIIHLNEASLNALVGDMHYRSLFETGTSRGNKCKETRHRWETNLFGGAYAKDCDPFERPKYGCLNVLGDIKGVRAAHGFGPMFLTLHPHIRHRATFANNDSGSTNTEPLASNDSYGHVLMRYSDAELKAVLDLMVDRSCHEKASGDAFEQYKEVQIHGPICLAKDIQSLSIPGTRAKASSSLRKTVEAFRKKAMCAIVWQDDNEDVAFQQNSREIDPRHVPETSPEVSKSDAGLRLERPPHKTKWRKFKSGLSKLFHK